MAIITNSLTQFEAMRKEQGYVPPYNSNSFHTIDTGEINLFTIRNNLDDYRFDISTNSGHIYTGPGNFIISGDVQDVENPYRNLTVITNTILSINQLLTISKGEFTVNGTVELMPHSQLSIRKNAKAVLGSRSILVINDNTTLSVENGSTLTIYGRIDVHISRINSILNAPNVILDSAAVLNVSGIDYTGRYYSMNEYESELRNKIINVNTQGDKSFDDGRISYIWRYGNPSEPSHVIGLNLQRGEMPLGDFRLPILGIPETTVPDMKILSDLVITRGSTFYITESFKDSTYIRPQLYLGIIINNNQTPANCVIRGTMIADGINSSIILDRGATLHIEEDGELYLVNGAVMTSSHNENKNVLFINGNLIIEDISQIRTFEANNIVIGARGKVTILNPDTGEKRLLFTTPNGILSSDLYRIFHDKMDNIEYHVQRNTGIRIDEYFENYSRDMTKWFGDRRFAKAIHDGILIWHDEAFIELDYHVIPWITGDSNLLIVGKLFKCFGGNDQERLQDVVERLSYAGCGNVLFRFIADDEIEEVLLQLESINIKSIINNPISKRYTLLTNNNGSLFLRNKSPNTAINTLIHPLSKIVNISNMNQVDFTL